MTMDDWLVLLLVLCFGWLCFAGAAAALHHYLRVMYPPTRIVVVKGERSEEATEGVGATDSAGPAGRWPRQPHPGDGVLSPAGLLAGLPPDQC